MADRDVGRRAETIHTLVCVECGSVSWLRALGWRAYRTDDEDEDEPGGVVFYCPACSGREFGPD